MIGGDGKEEVREPKSVAKADKLWCMCCIAIDVLPQTRSSGGGMMD